MSFNFPASPTQGQEFTAVPGGTTYVYIGVTWVIKSADAPNDGKTYGRKDFTWQEVLATSYPDAPADGKVYARKNNAWVEVVTPPPTTISDTAPVSPIAGQLWFESSTGALFMWYDDGSSAQWVQINSMAG